MSEMYDISLRHRQLEEEYKGVGRNLLKIRVLKSPEACGLDRKARTTVIYACIFNAACVTMQDTLFLLQAEADELAAIGKIDPVTVLGIHQDWLEGRALSSRRCLWVDEHGICNDVVLNEPILMNYIHFLHFREEGEIEVHRRLTAALQNRNVLLINPAGQACDICNSKWRTSKVLESANIHAPEILMLSRFSLADRTIVEERVRQFLQGIIQRYPGKNRYRFFLQPDTGTEARQVVCMNLGFDAKIDPSVIDRICSRTEDSVLRYGRGGLLTTMPKDQSSPAPFVVRVNAYEGMTPKNLSGFAIVAENTEADVVAISTGAVKVRLRAALENLTFSQGLHLSHRDFQTFLCQASQQTLRAVNAEVDPGQKIMLLGIDLIFEVVGQDMRAVVIDVNPRPVIAHSTFSSGEDEKVGLGLEYWRCVMR